MKKHIRQKPSTMSIAITLGIIGLSVQTATAAPRDVNRSAAEQKAASVMTQQGWTAANMAYAGTANDQSQTRIVGGLGGGLGGLTGGLTGIGGGLGGLGGGVLGGNNRGGASVGVGGGGQVINPGSGGSRDNVNLGGNGQINLDPEELEDLRGDLQDVREDLNRDIQRILNRYDLDSRNIGNLEAFLNGEIPTDLELEDRVHLREDLQALRDNLEERIANIADDYNLDVRQIGGLSGVPASQGNFGGNLQGGTRLGGGNRGSLPVNGGVRGGVNAGGNTGGGNGGLSLPVIGGLGGSGGLGLPVIGGLGGGASGSGGLGNLLGLGGGLLRRAPGNDSSTTAISQP